ncbi:MAG: flagellar hook protein FlgE [Armatimonadetes bacterium]|nr:flagellar hook protein FlgE [Armatimonadota bacterium]
MIQSLFTGVASLRAHQSRMDVIGNNIANVNTTAYKAGRVTFQDMLSLNLRGASSPISGGTGGVNPAQIGLGMAMGGIDTLLNQGGLQETNKATDLAIQGNGYFMISDGSNAFYTRDGGFSLDANGTLVNSATGMKLLGWQPDANGAIDTSIPVTAASALSIPVGAMTSSQATDNVEYVGNLDADADAAYTYTTSVRIFDSLGIDHLVELTFSNHTPAAGGGSTWDWSAQSNGVALGNGTASFNAEGAWTATQTANPADPNTGRISMALTNGASSPLDAELDFSHLTQLSGGTTVNAQRQDGFSLGTLESFNIGEDGLITGLFSNNMGRPLGRVALATFSNPAGLLKLGGNAYQESNNSGLPQVTTAASGGSGKISVGFLEMSNVDMGNEFTNMIVTQRGFQANSRVITTSDEMLQDLLSLKR